MLSLGAGTGTVALVSLGAGAATRVLFRVELLSLGAEAGEATVVELEVRLEVPAYCCLSDLQTHRLGTWYKAIEITL